jgi:hypothetical protein
MQSEELLTPEEVSTYARWLNLVNSTGVPYAIGGAYAVHKHTGIWRNTKDLDLFVRPGDVKPILNAMVEAGFETEVTNPAWLAKIRHRPYSMDLIFCLSNGGRIVDDRFLSRRQSHLLQHIETHVMAVEELVATKAFIAKHYRFDGADIVHLIRSRGDEIDWAHLLALFGDHYELLLWHLTFFSFVYPAETPTLPAALMQELFERLRGRWDNPPTADDFRGPLVDRSSFEIDQRLWGYANPLKQVPLLDSHGEAL